MKGQGEAVNPHLDIDGEMKTVESFVTGALRSNGLSDEETLKVMDGNVLHVLKAGL